MRYRERETVQDNGIGWQAMWFSSLMDASVVSLLLLVFGCSNFGAHTVSDD